MLSRSSDDLSAADILEQWDRYNRAAMVHCAEWPAMVLKYEELVTKPMSIALELDAFFEECGLAVTTDAKEAVELVEGHSPDQRARFNGPIVDGPYRVLVRVLEELDGRRFSGKRDPSENPRALVE